MSILTEIGETPERDKRKQVAQLIQQALDEGLAPQQVLTEVLAAARAMGAGIEVVDLGGGCGSRDLCPGRRHSEQGQDHGGRHQRMYPHRQMRLRPLPTPSVPWQM